MAKNRAQDLNELLSAYLDGELDEAGRAEVVAHLERDADAVKLLSALRQTRAMLQDLPRETAPDDFVDDVLAAVERQALLGRPGDQPAVSSIRRRWGPIRSAAAVVLLVGAAGSWVFWQIDQSATPHVASNGAPARSTFDERMLEEAATSAASGLAKLDDAGGDGTLFGNRDAGLELASAAKYSDAESGLAGEFDEDHIVLLDSDRTADTPEDKIRYFDLGRARRLRTPSVSERSTVSLTGQLIEGQPVEALAGYPFANESNALTFEFGSDAERQRFVLGMDTYLTANSFLDVADPRQRGQVTQPDLQNVFLKGHAGVNYAEHGSEQVLISAPAEMLEGLIDRYVLTAGAALDKNSVQLQIGDVQVQGVEQARRVARGMAVPQLRDRVLKSAGETNDQAGIATYVRADERSPEEWEHYYVQLGSVRRARLAEVVSNDKDEATAPAAGGGEGGLEEEGRVPRRSKKLGAEVDEHGRIAFSSIEIQQPQAASEGQRQARIDESDPANVAQEKERHARREGASRRGAGEAFGTREGAAGGPAAMAKKAVKIESRAPQDLGRLGQFDDRARGRRRAGNLTFILKLQVAPPPLEFEGPPAPPTSQTLPAAKKPRTK